MKRSRAWRCPRCHDFTAILVVSGYSDSHLGALQTFLWPLWLFKSLPSMSLGWISSRTVVLPTGSGFQLAHTFNSPLFSRSEWRFWYTLPVCILVTHFLDTYLGVTSLCTQPRFPIRPLYFRTPYAIFNASQTIKLESPP